MSDSIAPQPGDAVAAHIRALQQLTLDIDTALRGRDLPASPRSRMALGCLDLAVEHLSGIGVLADQPLWGPTFALLRILFEAFIRGVWLARCATEDQLAWFVDGKLDKHRNFQQLISEVEKALKHEGGALSKLREQAWRIFNDFTHTGIQHVVRRNSETATGPNYTDLELIQALRFAKAIGLLAAIEMLSLSGHDDQARALKLKAEAVSPVGERARDESVGRKPNGDFASASKAQKRRLDWTALGTWALAVITVCALLASDRGVRMQLREMQEERRAWVAPLAASPEEPFSSASHMKVKILFANSGKEPALNTRIHSEIRVLKSEDDALPNDYTNKPIEACLQGTPDPGSLRRIGTIYPSVGSSTYETRSESDYFASQDVVEARHTVLAVGCFSYETLGVTHHSSFCFVRDPDLRAPWKFCNRGNEAD